MKIEVIKMKMSPGGEKYSCVRFVNNNDDDNYNDRPSIFALNAADAIFRARFWVYLGKALNIMRFSTKVAFSLISISKKVTITDVYHDDMTNMCFDCEKKCHKKNLRYLRIFCKKSKDFFANNVTLKGKWVNLSNFDGLLFLIIKSILDK